MSSDTCVMPDGNCSGCNHCDHDEVICVATKEYKKTCSTDCENCDYCDEGEAFCDLESVDDLIPICNGCPDQLTFETADHCAACVKRYIADMRRYLYRNVACEAKKTSDNYRHIPKIPGWS